MNTQAIEFQKDLERDLFIIRNTTGGITTDVLELQKLLKDITKDAKSVEDMKNKMQDVENEYKSIFAKFQSKLNLPFFDQNTNFQMKKVLILTTIFGGLNNIYFNVVII